ncbi:Imm50 family immunity protein [Rahnella sp. PCH160]|uniref:Imm50 family immunity protein n=1 Tax=Rahnella sp. PCH160 TaxID=3447928 RepID=UPI0039FD1A04
MKPWTDYLVNARHIDSIYHKDKPSLNNVDIHEVIFHRDGPKISIRMNLNEFPTSPPPKWVAQKFNTVQIILTLVDIGDVSMSGWVDTNYIANITIEQVNGKICMNVSNASLKLVIKSSFMDIESVAAYTRK